MTDKIVELDSRRKGWRSEPCLCLACCHRWIGVLHPNVKDTKLECPECRKLMGISSSWMLCNDGETPQEPHDRV